MEIQTTVKDLPEKIRRLGISPETSIRVIIDELRVKSGREKSHFPFLDDEVWDEEGAPTDISANVDYYLYDLDDVHGE